MRSLFLGYLKLGKGGGHACGRPHTRVKKTKTAETNLPYIDIINIGM